MMTVRLDCTKQSDSCQGKQSVLGPKKKTSPRAFCLTHHGHAWHWPLSSPAKPVAREDGRVFAPTGFHLQNFRLSPKNISCCSLLLTREKTESFPGFGEGSETAVTLAGLREMGRKEKNSIEINFLNSIPKPGVFYWLYIDSTFRWLGYVHSFWRPQNVCLKDRSCEALQMFSLEKEY